MADIVAGDACSSLGGGFFSSPLGVMFGHGRSSPLLINGLIDDVFQRLKTPAKTA
jgi:hypothetical protein